MRCPPTKGGVEMLSILYAPPLLSPPNHDITAQLEVWTKNNETRIVCLNSTIEIRDAACNPPPDGDESGSLDSGVD